MAMTSTERAAKYRASRRNIGIAIGDAAAIARLAELTERLGTQRAALEYALVACPAPPAKDAQP